MDEKTLKKDILNIKTQLIAKAKKKGIWENFGQDKLRELDNKYCEFQYTKPLCDFNTWCMNFDDNDLKGE